MAAVRRERAVLRPGRGRQVRRGRSGDRCRGQLAGPAVLTHARRRREVVRRPVRPPVVDHGGGVGRAPGPPPDGARVGDGRRPRVGGPGRRPARGAQPFPDTGPLPPAAADRRRPASGRRGQRRRTGFGRAGGGGPAGTDGGGGAGGPRRPAAAPRPVPAAAARGPPRRGGLRAGPGQRGPVVVRTAVTRLSPPRRGTGRKGVAVVGPDPPTGPMYALVPAWRPPRPPTNRCPHARGGPADSAVPPRAFRAVVLAPVGVRPQVARPVPAGPVGGRPVAARPVPPGPVAVQPGRRPPRATRPGRRRPRPGCPRTAGPAVAGHLAAHPDPTAPRGVRVALLGPDSGVERAEHVVLAPQRLAVVAHHVGAAPGQVDGPGTRRRDERLLRARGGRLQRGRQVDLAQLHRRAETLGDRRRRRLQDGFDLVRREGGPF